MSWLSRVKAWARLPADRAFFLAAFWFAGIGGVLLSIFLSAAINTPERRAATRERIINEAVAEAVRE